MIVETIYSVRSQKAYNKLLSELEGKTTWWRAETEKLTDKQLWHVHGRKTVICLRLVASGSYITIDSKEGYEGVCQIFTPGDKLDDRFMVVHK